MTKIMSLAVIVLLLFFSSAVSAGTYTLRTQAIDGPDFLADGSYTKINPSTISIDGTSKTGNPWANFNVNAGETFSVSYSAAGYDNDIDDFYLDEDLSSCSGSSCELSSFQFDTSCDYSYTWGDWECIVTDTDNGQVISFIYKKNDPNYGETVRSSNALFPEEVVLCTDNDNDGYFVGDGNCGEVDCNDNNAAINPGASEVCNSYDDNCDGDIDEGNVCDECSIDSDCDDDLTDNICIGELFIGQTSDYFCLSGNCGVNIFNTTLADCSDLDDVSYSSYCDSNNDSVQETLTTSGTCSSSGCSTATTTTTTTQNCTDGCINGVCEQCVAVQEICGNGIDEDCDGSDLVCTVENDTAPASVSNLRETALTKYSILWNWTNPNDTDFELCLVYLDGVNVLNTSNESYLATGLNEDTTYNLSVFTMDNSSNINWTGATDDAKTLKSDEDDDDDDDVRSKKNNSTGQNINYFVGRLNDSGVIKLGTVRDNNTFSWVIWVLILLILISLMGFSIARLI